MQDHDAITTLTTLSARIEALEQHCEQITHHLDSSLALLSNLRDLVLHKQTHELQRAHPNPLNRFGKQCFSQSDEDGITLEIVRRLGIDTGTYAEFGVGNGLENNTLILASLGWRGFWVGGEALAIRHEGSPRFRYFQEWVTLDNLLHCLNQGRGFLGADEIDVVSLDFDGNDIHFVGALLEGHCLPKLFIVEYNGKFPPPARFQIAYDAHHHWRGDDYFGAALMNFVELFARFGYRLVCCNAHTGANAFFIRGDFAARFDDVPGDPRELHVGPRYHLYARHGHSPSARVVESVLGIGE